MIRDGLNRKVRVDRIAVAGHSHHVLLDGHGHFVVHRHEIDIDRPEHGHVVTSGGQFQMSSTLLAGLRADAKVTSKKGNNA